MCNKNLPKLARKYLPYKNQIPLAPEVNLCLELAPSRVQWGVLLLSKSALSLSITSVFGSILCPPSPRTCYLCPLVTPNTGLNAQPFLTPSY